MHCPRQLIQSFNTWMRHYLSTPHPSPCIICSSSAIVSRLTLRKSSQKLLQSPPWRHLSKVNWIRLARNFIYPNWLGRKSGRSCAQTGENKQEWNTQLVSRPAFCDILFCLHRDIIDRFFEPILVGVDPIHQLSIFLVIACQVILGQSRRGCSFMFSMLQYLVQLCLMRNAEKLPPRDQLLLSDFPGDPRPAEKALCLDRQSIIFAMCPKDSCHQGHKPTFNPGSPIPIYPEYCRGHHFGKLCKEELLRPKWIQGNVVLLPIKPFVYFCIEKHFGYLPTSASTLSHLTVAGLTYSTVSKHSGNSCVLLDSSSKNHFLPAQIEHIVQFVSNDDIPGVNTLVALRRFKRLSNHSDPFSNYPLLQTQIWRGDLGALELHPVSAIQCHFACSTIRWEGEQVMVMVSLSRVHPDSLITIVTKFFHRNFKCSTQFK